MPADSRRWKHFAGNRQFVLGISLCCVTIPAKVSGQATSPQVQAGQVKALVARQARAWEEHDFSIAAGDWLPDGELTSPGGHVAVRDMQAGITGYFKQFTALHVTVKNVFVSPDGTRAAIEWDWRVTRRRDGVSGVTHDAIVVDLVGGKIKSWREYFDFGNSVDAHP